MQQTSYGTLTITDTTDIARVQNWYLASSSSSGVQKTDSGWTTDVTNANATMTATKQYLWNYEQIQGEGANGSYITISTTDPVIIGRYGQNGGTGAAGRGITSIDEYYQATNSTSKPGSSGWQKNTLVTPTATKRYLWNYQVINYINPTSTQGSYEDARIIGVYGDKGETGTSVTNISSSKSGDETTITISMSDGTSKQFTVKDGAQGDTGATAQWYYGTDLSHTSGTATLAISKTSDVVVGSMYLNPDTSLCYRCTAISGSNATWTYAGDLATGVINNIEIGGRNLVYNSSLTGDMSKWAGYNTTVWQKVTKDNHECLMHEGSFNTTVTLTLPLTVNKNINNYGIVPYDDLILTFSADVLFENVVRGTTNYFVALYGNGATINNSWKETIAIKGHPACPAGALSPDVLNGKGWTRVWWTYKYVDADWGTKYVKPQFFARDYTGKVYVKNIKLEYGNVPTDWTPAPEDTEATIDTVKADFSFANETMSSLIQKANNDNSRLIEQLSKIEQTLNEIKLHVSSVANNKTFYAGEDISSYITEEPPTLLNYPTFTDFFIWPVCNTTLSCDDTLNCGTNNYAAYENRLAHCVTDDTYYIFKKDAANEYYWENLTFEEYKNASSKFSSIDIKEDQISIVSALNSNLTELLIDYNGIKTTSGKLFCC